MSGFEFTSSGIAPLGGSDEVDYSKTLFLDIRTNGEGGDPAAHVAPPVAAPVAVAAPDPAKAAPAALKPRDVVRQAKARIRELRVQLKRAKTWERELAQLERLVAAADGKQIAVVKPIDSRRAG